tara:strand:- start:865 stop:1080 length:216 start_codon:yes stop_codon:yes gene_type:complete
MPSNAFIGRVKQLDVDTIQYMLWSYEDALNAGAFSGQNIDTVIEIIQFLKSYLGQPDTVDYVIAKMPICLN